MSSDSEKKIKFPLGGVKAAADLLSALDRDTRERIMNEISERDPEVFKKLKHKLVRFETLLTLETSSLQNFLRTLPLPKLALSLRGLDSATFEGFLKGLSKATQVTLKEEMSLQGPQPITTVELARQEIVALAQTAKLLP